MLILILLVPFFDRRPVYGVIKLEYNQPKWLSQVCCKIRLGYTVSKVRILEASFETFGHKCEECATKTPAMHEESLTGATRNEPRSYIRHK